MSLGSRHVSLFVIVYMVVGFTTTRAINADHH